MKYVFVSPQIVEELYFCSHTGDGFRLSNRLEDALVSTDPESAQKVSESLKRQSGFLVQPKRVLRSGAVIDFHAGPAPFLLADLPR